jgi:DNA polymerase-3 subunit gamma/tau
MVERVQQALYRRWRPQRFSEVVGQEYTVKTLQNAVAQGWLHHAYLFAGPRGTGKTSVARILAKAVNCENPQEGEPCNECSACQRIGRGISLDVIEIDGASNRGIDQIRQLREEVNFVPGETKYKVYIIDEVHMLTNEAFNALLKTLEEPPRRVIFIFATTEPHKLPPTVASRCQAFEFKLIPPELIEKRLERICAVEGITASPKALEAIARRAKGSLRDAEVLLEQLASYKGGKEIGEEDLLQVLGLPSEEMVADFLRSILAGDSREALETIASLSEGGKDPELFLESAVELCRDLIVARLGGTEDKWLSRLGDADDHALIELSDRLLGLKRELRFALDKRIVLEVGTLRIIAALKGIEGKKEENILPEATPPAEENPEPERAAAPLDEEGDKRWQQMLETIKQERVAVYAFLTEGRPVLQRDRLRIEYAPDYKFHKESLEKPENRSFLEEMVQRFYGDLAVEISFGSKSPKPNPQAEQLRRKVELIKRSFHGKLIS